MAKHAVAYDLPEGGEARIMRVGDVRRVLEESQLEDDAQMFVTVHGGRDCAVDFIACSQQIPQDRLGEWEAGDPLVWGLELGSAWDPYDMAEPASAIRSAARDLTLAEDELRRVLTVQRERGVAEDVIQKALGSRRG